MATNDNETTTIPADSELVRAWLASKAPDEIVGRGGQMNACPLAIYLRDHGAPCACVDSDMYWTDTARDGLDMPAWASEFVIQVDRSGPTGHSITASAALEMLTGGSL